MTKSNKKKPESQKKVSSVFKGVPDPDSEQAERSEHMSSTPTNCESSQSPKAGRTDRPCEVAKRTVPAYIAASAASMSTNSENSQGPEGGNVDIPRKSVGRITSERPAASPKPEPAKQQGAQSSLIKRMAECQETSQEPEAVKTNEPPRKSVPARAVDSPHKPEPIEQPKSDSFVETGGPTLGQWVRDRVVTSRLASGTAKDKVMAMLVPILAVVMVFMFRQVLSKPPGKVRGGTPDDAPLVITADTGDEIVWEIPEPMPVVMRDPAKLANQDDTQSETSDGTQEPGQDGATSETQTAAFRIKSLVYSKDKPSIVVGDKIVHLGGKINGATIIRINKHSVEFERDGETWIQKVRD